MTSAPTTPSRLAITVAGRPAPQGSKRHGAYGQMREASPYLAAWRAAVKLAVYERYYELGIERDALPLLRGPVVVTCAFVLPAGQRVDSPPDLDKLLRSTWDALTQARVWEDDGRVISVSASKRPSPPDGFTGAVIVVWPVELSAPIQTD